MPAMPQIHQVPAGSPGQQQQVQMIPQAPSVWQKCAYFFEVLDALMAVDAASDFLCGQIG